MPRPLLPGLSAGPRSDSTAIMTLTELDILVRGGALALLALLAALLLRDHPRAMSARMAVALILGVACTVIAERDGLQIFSGPVATALLIGEASISGSFWLFARSWFDDEVRFGWRSWSLVAFTLALSLANFALWTPGRGNYWLTDLPMHAMWLGLAFAGLWTAWRGRENDLVEPRRRLRIGFIGATGGAVVVINLVYLTNNLTTNTRYPAVVLGISLLTLAVLAGLSITILGLRRGDLFEGTTLAMPEGGSAPDHAASAALAEKLQVHMARERSYRDETLTIAALAAQLGEQEYRLRRAINGRLGYRNFARFLNGYRLEEVKAALRDPAQREVPILTIAIDAGFGSLGTFNRAFREAEGTTPSAFRAAALGKRT